MCTVYLCPEPLVMLSIPAYTTTRCQCTCVQNHQMCTVYLCTKPLDVDSVPVHRSTRCAQCTCVPNHQTCTVYLCIIEMLCQLSHARPCLLSGWPTPATLESPPGTLHKKSSASFVFWCAPPLERASVLWTFSQTTTHTQKKPFICSGCLRVYLIVCFNLLRLHSALLCHFSTCLLYTSPSPRDGV